MQLDVDAVLAVFQAARGEFQEDRTPVAARGALEDIAFAFAQAQAGAHQHAQLGRAIHRHAAQLQLDGLAPAGRARVETADVQLRAAQAAAGGGLGAQRTDCLEARGQAATWRRRIGSRLGVSVRTQLLAGHDPDGAVRMLGVAAAVHGAMADSVVFGNIGKLTRFYCPVARHIH